MYKAPIRVYREGIHIVIKLGERLPRNPSIAAAYSLVLNLISDQLLIDEI